MILGGLRPWISASKITCKNAVCPKPLYSQHLTPAIEVNEVIAMHQPFSRVLLNQYYHNKCRLTTSEGGLVYGCSKQPHLKVDLKGSCHKEKQHHPSNTTIKYRTHFQKVSCKAFIVLYTLTMTEMKNERRKFRYLIYQPILHNIG